MQPRRGATAIAARSRSLSAGSSSGARSASLPAAGSPSLLLRRSRLGCTRASRLAGLLLARSAGATGRRRGRPPRRAARRGRGAASEARPACAVDVRPHGSPRFARAEPGTVSSAKVARVDVGDLVPLERAADPRVRHGPHRVAPRRRCGRGRSGCSRRRPRGAPPSTTCWSLASGSRRSTSRASASAARRTSTKSQRGSIRTLTWMPREPEVFGKPTRPCSSSTSRTHSATWRTVVPARPRASGRGRPAARRDGRGRRGAPATG